MTRARFAMQALSGNDILRMHPMRRHRHQKRQREAIGWRLTAAKVAKPELPPAPARLQVTLTRIYPAGRRRFDGDNLQFGFKAMRDGIADWLEVNDGSDRLHFVYAQEPGQDHVHRVDVAFEVLP